jgi:DNA polymerase elongation subunit (family B)
MLEQLKFNNVLFLDVETAPIVYKYRDLSDKTKTLWDAKFRPDRFRDQENQTPESMYNKAGIYAEFSKVICISAGFFNEDTFRIKSFCGHDEKVLLADFSALLNKHFNRKEHLLCAHNGKEFDFPFLCRRLLVNGLKLPKALSIAGKKPWEVNHLDTLELWKFGDYKNYTSLNLLAHIFDIPTPKNDMDGSDVARVYWEEKNLERIATYCQKDVITVAQLLLRYTGRPLIENKNVVFA